MRTNRKEIVRRSKLLAQIRTDFEAWKEAGPDFDGNYFDESSMIPYYDFLVSECQGEWVIIGDIREGSSDEGAI